MAYAADLPGRLAAIQQLQERTYARSLTALRDLTMSVPPQDSSLELLRAAEVTLRTRGFTHLRGVIHDDALLQELDAHISAVERASQAAKPTAEHASGSLLPPALEPEQRSDVLLALDAPVTNALCAALVGHGLQALLETCLGADALLWELSAMRSRPGARAQPFHPDVKWQRDEPSALVVWIATHDVTLEMGPTLLVPGTHTKRAHDAFDAAQGGSLPPDFVAAAAVGADGPEAPLLQRGDALVMDSRVLHCGLANRSECERTLFYFTFRRNGDADAEWQQSSLRQSLRDRYELDHLCHALREVSPADWS